VLGSNVFNLAALLGLGAVVASRIALHRKVAALGGAIALWVAIVSLVTVMRIVDPVVGLLLVLGVLGPYILMLGLERAKLHALPLPTRWIAWLAAAVDEEEFELEVAIRPPRGTSVDALVAAGALVVVVAASVAMERGASALGQRYNISEIVVGGLVLAAATSLPNAVAGVHLARRGRGAAALSTTLSSNTLNVAAGLLIPAVVVGLGRPSGDELLAACWYVGLTALTLAFAYAERGLRRWAGWVVIAGYAAFVAALLSSS
jgi:cation:H+ antiporter